MRTHAALLCIALLTACASAPAAQDFTIEGPQQLPGGASLSPLLETGRAKVESFFGKPFAAPVRVSISPTRATFDASLPAKWELTPTQCWMVGVGGGNLFALLSPSAWSTDACEHDGNDTGHIQEVVTHELTHVYHGQRNPTGDFIGMDDAGWFVEGLAVLVAGQLTSGNRPTAAQAIASGAAPAHLADAWSGKFRYGVSGSMVAFIDASFGRAKLIELLGDVTNAQILNRLGLTETEFMARWKIWVGENA